MDLRQSWDYIEEIAQRRLEHNKSKWHVKEYGTDIEVLGAAGELAAHRLLGLPEKLHDQHDGGVDIWWRGYRIDVKTTHLTWRFKYRYLQWPIKKPLKADIVLLMGVNMNLRFAACAGFALETDVKASAINYERNFPCHEIPITELRPEWELFTVRPRSQRHQNKTTGKSLSNVMGIA